MKKYFVLLTALMTVLTLTACTAAADSAMPAAYAAPAASKAPVQEEPAPDAAAAPQPVEAAPAKDVLSPEAAQAAALAHAGLTADEVTYVRTHLDHDDGRKEYEIEFYCGDREYDYDIDALTGAIRSFDSELEHREHKSDSSEQSTELLAEAEAKAIALEHAGVAEANARFHKVHLDTDDGRKEYDIEFRAGHMEYEYEIDAQSGRILDFDKDRDD